ncbi:MAG: NAD-dependent epimerase/dehydratase family protein [Deltaproteobacteria bacterium]|nr:NAD-dependent epimerase/dehydratase family protein [Deltaproteobacteria bacterium]
MATRKKKPSKVAATAEGGPAGSPHIVAVTGAFGAFGRRLLPLLEADPDIERVVAIDVRHPAVGRDVDPAAFLAAHGKLTAHTLDLAEAGADTELAKVLEVERAGALIHLALLSSPTHALEMAHEAETIGTLHVLHAAAAARVGYVLSLSSAMCYGARADNPAWITEEQPLRPPPSRSLRDKADAERQVLRFGEEHAGCAVAVARVGAVLGSAEDHFWSRLLGRRAVPAVLGYDPLMQLMLVDDVAGALHAILRARARGAFNVVGRGVLPLSHVLSRLSRLPIYVPPGIGRSVLGALWTAQLSDIPRHFLDYLRWSWVCDGARLTRETGFVPSHDIDTTLQVFASGAWRDPQGSATAIRGAT